MPASLSPPRRKAPARRPNKKKAAQLAQSRQQLFTRRSVVLGLTQAAVLAGLAGRLYYLQIVEGQKYARIAEQNRTNTLMVVPSRGRLLDRHGRALALNEKNFRIFLIPERSTDVATALMRLDQITPIAQHRHDEILRRVRQQPGFVPILAIENLAWEQFSQVNFNLHDMPGFEPAVSEKRAYPGGQLFSHIIGYVGPPNSEDIKSNPIYRIPGLEIGRRGLEQILNPSLIGKPGSKNVEVQASGRHERQISLKPPQNGSDITLSLDFDIQRIAFDAMGEKNGAVVVIEISSGNTLALISKPAFDPNLFITGISHAAWRKLLDNPHKPLLNKALAGQYPPGSTIKMIMAAAILHDRIATPHEKIYCRGSYTFKGKTFHCWKKRGHGPMDLNMAIRQSCDVYFYEMARRLGIKRIHAMARRFGLGTVSGLPLRNEAAGLVPSPAWKKQFYQQPWHEGETLICGIGQGYFLATPIQLALMTAQIANGGAAIRPRLILDNAAMPRQRTTVLRPAIDLPAGIFDFLREAMSDVVNHPRGTAYSSRLHSEGIQMAGKTGTSQVIRIDHDAEEDRTIPWRHRNHALFVGFAPFDAPRYALAVVIEHGGGGASAAAPVAREIMDFILGRDFNSGAAQA